MPTSRYTGDGGGDDDDDGAGVYAEPVARSLLHVGVVGSCGAKHGDPHRGGMHSILCKHGMLLEAEDRSFDKDDDMVSAMALASVQLNLLQPETLSKLKLQRMMRLYTALSIITTSRTVYDWLKDGPAERAQQDGPLAKVIKIIIELQTCLAAEGIPTVIDYEPATCYGDTPVRHTIAGAGLLASTAGRQCGTYAVVSHDWTVLTVQCDEEGQATSYKLGGGAPCQPPQQALALLQDLLQRDVPGEEDGSGSGGDSSSSSDDEEGGCPDGRPTKRARISGSGRGGASGSTPPSSL